MAILQILDLFRSFTTGFPQSVPNGTELQALVNQLFTYQNGITAYATGGQTSATRITAAINEISTAAHTTAGHNSVMLNIALPGNFQFVINDAANGIQVFGNANNPSNGNVSDTIALSTSTSQSNATTGVVQASAAVGLYICFKLGEWKQFLTA